MKRLALFFVLAVVSCAGSEQEATSTLREDRTPVASKLQAVESDRLSANPLLEAVAEALREHNPRVGRFAILDIATLAPGRSRYVLIGYGVRSDQLFEGDVSEELFGIFIADSSLMRITRTLEILPTPRWRDYELLIERLTADSVIISGKGATYGDGPMRRSYSWSPWLQR